MKHEKPPKGPRFMLAYKRAPDEEPMAIETWAGTEAEEGVRTFPSCNAAMKFVEHNMAHYSFQDGGLIVVAEIKQVFKIGVTIKKSKMSVTELAMDRDEDYER